MRDDYEPGSFDPPDFPSSTFRTPLVAFVIEWWAFMRERKKWWLAPMILVLVLFGALIVLTEGSAVAPFIYTLF